MPGTKHAAKPAAEELVLYGLLVATGSIPLVITYASGWTFGVEATIGLFMVCAGIVGGLGYVARSLRGRR